jgi:AcrR family transcriptional regulator
MSPQSKSAPAPAPKQARAVDTIALVLQVTNKYLLSGGEAAVRVQEISKAANVSIGSIYHHFGDRDGLIRAAYVERFRNAIQDDIERVKRFMARMHSAKEMAEHYDEMLAFLNHHFEQFPARDQATTIGSTTGRPPLREAIIEVQSELTSSLAEVMQLLKDRGILKPHLDPRAAAVLTLGMLHGRVISELDRNPVNDECWNTAFLTAFSGLFVGTDSLPIWGRLANGAAAK